MAHRTASFSTAFPTSRPYARYLFVITPGLLAAGLALAGCSSSSSGIPRSDGFGDAGVERWRFSWESDAKAFGGASGVPSADCSFPSDDTPARVGTTICEGTGTWRSCEADGDERYECTVDFDGGGSGMFVMNSPLPDLEDGSPIEFSIESTRDYGNYVPGQHWNVKRLSDDATVLEGGYRNPDFDDKRGPNLSAAAKMLGVPLSVTDDHLFTYSDDCAGEVQTMLKTLTVGTDPPLKIEPGHSATVATEEGTFSIFWSGDEIQHVDPNHTNECEDYSHPDVLALGIKLLFESN